MDSQVQQGKEPGSQKSYLLLQVTMETFGVWEGVQSAEHSGSERAPVLGAWIQLLMNRISW